jgi:cytochrome P450
MMLYPSVQAKARVELDAITNGGTRLPTLADRESCTYLDAVLKELHRWNPVGPLGEHFNLTDRFIAHMMPIALPHSVMVDDEYKGMLIPRGSVIIANTWWAY